MDSFHISWLSFFSFSRTIWIFPSTMSVVAKVLYWFSLSSYSFFALNSLISNKEASTWLTLPSISSILSSTSVSWALFAPPPLSSCWAWFLFYLSTKSLNSLCKLFTFSSYWTISSFNYFICFSTCDLSAAMTFPSPSIYCFIFSETWLIWLLKISSCSAKCLSCAFLTDFSVMIAVFSYCSKSFNYLTKADESWPEVFCPSVTY